MWRSGNVKKLDF
jgi:hypothetical protein